MTRGKAKVSAATFATVAGFKRSTGVQVDERVVVEALAELHSQGWLQAGDDTAAEPLSGSDIEFLDTHGGVRDNRAALMKARISAAVRAASVFDETLTVDQAAELLDVSPSRVRHRISDGTLYSYPGEGRGVARRLPSWQFLDGEPIPHLAEVLDALPEDFTPVEVRDFVLNAQVEHPARGITVDLAGWLVDGGDPAPAIELAAAQAEVA
jgi:hypothetical protein